MFDQKTRDFEQNRKTLEGIAYRMLGTLDDARDIVQDTYLKWEKTDIHTIANPRAWLVTVCSRLALNRMQAAQTKRETYFGIWLPEPLLGGNDMVSDAQMELDESVSMAHSLWKPCLRLNERCICSMKSSIIPMMKLRVYCQKRVQMFGK